MPSHLFPLCIRPDGIVQLQGKARLCMTDNKNLKGKTNKKKHQELNGENALMASLHLQAV